MNPFIQTEDFVQDRQFKHNFKTFRSFESKKITFSKAMVHSSKAEEHGLFLK